MNQFLTPTELRLLLLTVAGERQAQSPPPDNNDALPNWPDPAAEEAARNILASMRDELQGGKE